MCSYTRPPLAIDPVAVPPDFIPPVPKPLEHYKQFKPQIPLALETYNVVARLDKTNNSREDVRKYLHEEKGGFGSRASRYSSLLDGFDHVKLLATPFLVQFTDGTLVDSQPVLDALKQAIEEYRQDNGLPRIKIEIYL